MCEIDLFSWYVLFFHYRSYGNTLENCFFQILSYSCAYLLINAKLHCLVRATVISRIDYCNSLLFKIPAVHIAKLQRIQNSAARLVYYIPRFEHITPVLYRLHWLPVSFRIEYKVLILTYKAIHGYAPLYISDLIRTGERTNYNLRSSSQLLLQPYNATKTKKTLGDRAFQVASPGLWNGLPNDIRNAKTMDVFKSLVKTHLFRKAYACYFFLFFFLLFLFFLEFYIFDSV